MDQNDNETSQQRKARLKKEAVRLKRAIASEKKERDRNRLKRLHEEVKRNKLDATGKSINTDTSQNINNNVPDKANDNNVCITLDKLTRAAKSDAVDKISKSFVFRERNCYSHNSDKTHNISDDSFETRDDKVSDAIENNYVNSDVSTEEMTVNESSSETEDYTVNREKESRIVTHVKRALSFARRREMRLRRQVRRLTNRVNTVIVNSKKSVTDTKQNITKFYLH